MGETAETIVQRAALATATVGALAQRGLEEHVPDAWRVGDLVGADRRPAGSIAEMTLVEATDGDLIILDSSRQGVPRSAAWLRRAIDLLEHAEVDDGAEVERLQAELEREQTLRAERQQAADVAQAEYLALVLRDQHAQPRELPVIERFGQRFSVVDQTTPVPSMPLVLGEDEPRSSSSRRVQAFYRWQDLQAEVVAGPETDRRTIALADGSEELLETHLTKRVQWLRHMAGRRESRLGQLHDHLERATATADPAQQLVVVDERGTQWRGVLPASLSRLPQRVSVS